jgi:hypothetical protein
LIISRVHLHSYPFLLTSGILYLLILLVFFLLIFIYSIEMYTMHEYSSLWLGTNHFPWRGRGYWHWNLLLSQIYTKYFFHYWRKQQNDHKFQPWSTFFFLRNISLQHFFANEVRCINIFFFFLKIIDCQGSM